MKGTPIPLHWPPSGWARAAQAPGGVGDNTKGQLGLNASVERQITFVQPVRTWGTAPVTSVRGGGLHSVLLAGVLQTLANWSEVHLCPVGFVPNQTCMRNDALENPLFGTNHPL